MCGKLIYQQIPLYYIKFKLCSECYQISSGWVESTLAKKTIPILCLSWWDTCDQCIACNQILEFKSGCQKWCSYCNIIYNGCRYYLTTNIIFGITDQSQCKKCERVSLIAIDTKSIEKEFLVSAIINI